MPQMRTLVGCYLDFAGCLRDTEPFVATVAMACVVIFSRFDVNSEAEPVEHVPVTPSPELKELVSPVMRSAAHDLAAPIAAASAEFSLALAACER